LLLLHKEEVTMVVEIVDNEEEFMIRVDGETIIHLRF
jgi:hypothetical protein